MYTKDVKTKMTLREITKDALSEILKKHLSWINDEPGGEKADLSYADLRYADLSYANLSYADLSYANLSYADNPKSSWYYAFRFLGAYLNYRKRMKATSITSVEEETKE